MPILANGGSAYSGPEKTARKVAPSYNIETGSIDAPATRGLGNFGVTTTKYRKITPITFSQQLKRKGIMLPETQDPDSINAAIRGHYNLQEGVSSPYQVVQDESGKLIYQKDFGRVRGAYTDPETGKVKSSYNIPRVGR